MKKWMLVVALVVGIMIGSLIDNPFKGEAGSSDRIDFVGRRGSCFAIFKDSITFVREIGSSGC